MVNLPQETGERRLRRTTRVPRSHHNWGVHLTPEERAITLRGPRTLNELEVLARRAITRIASSRTTPVTHADYQEIIALLRQEYNLEFQMLCTICYGTHGYDEEHAPER